MHVCHSLRAAAETRLGLEQTIRALERQIKELGAAADVPIPPPEPVTVVIHTISAVGIPDADAAGTATRARRGSLVVVVNVDADEALRRSPLLTAASPCALAHQLQRQRIRVSTVALLLRSGGTGSASAGGAGAACGAKLVAQRGQRDISGSPFTMWLYRFDPVA